MDKKMVPRKDSKYEVSPWALTWDDENYYLIAFDSEADKIKHYRVDKMRGIEILEEKREGRAHFEEFDMATYARINFGMFGGKEVKVKLRFKNDLVGVLLDRFGKDITIRRTGDEEWAEANVDVALSEQFLGWIFSFGNAIKIVGPDEVVERFTKDIKALEKLYNNN